MKHLKEYPHYDNVLHGVKTHVLDQTAVNNFTM